MNMHICMHTHTHTHTHTDTCRANMAIQHTYNKIRKRWPIAVCCSCRWLQVQLPSGHHAICTTNAPVRFQLILPTSANPTNSSCAITLNFWKRYEPTYPSSNGLISTTHCSSKRVALALNEDWYSIQTKKSN